MTVTELFTQCEGRVPDGGRMVTFHQCQNKPRPGSRFCGVHQRKERRTKAEVATPPTAEPEVRTSIRVTVTLEWPASAGPVSLYGQRSVRWDRVSVTLTSRGDPYSFDGHGVVLKLDGSPSRNDVSDRFVLLDSLPVEVQRRIAAEVEAARNSL